ncbi:hypothetical protein ACTI_74170 [Actinoplanes sp. OR16]|uniref:NACHT N-terminal helical domain 7-containing protein n=1 Tax=Actinoplanes sp. OR16 TaxID=946334 RepID=UPI000F712BA3|nr:hypothetical protein [Actinoplanes sp. OR16]BBH70732.1 hypothetical protein ACTI_74170 [Actinoplanes sp. OR16]
MVPLSYRRARECFAPWWVNRVRAPADRAVRLLVAAVGSPIPSHPPRGWGWGAVPADPDERIMLAHSVLVGVAGFDAFRDTIGPDVYAAARLTTWEQIILLPSLSTDMTDTSQDAAGLLLAADVPAPGPNVRYRENLDRLHDYFDLLGDRVHRFVSALALPDRLSKDCPPQMPPMAGLALRRYNALVRRLAAEAPEFAGWLSMNEMLTPAAPFAGGYRRPSPTATLVAPQPPADVHLLFADDQRRYVEAVAAALSDAGLGVRLYTAPDPMLHGARLVDRLRRMYGGAAAASVLFLSAGYSSRMWQGHARLQAHARFLAEFSDRVLLVRTDTTTRLPLPPDPNWFADARFVEPEGLAALLYAELT